MPPDQAPPTDLAEVGDRTLRQEGETQRRDRSVRETMKIRTLGEMEKKIMRSDAELYKQV